MSDFPPACNTDKHCSKCNATGIHLTQRGTIDDKGIHDTEIYLCAECSVSDLIRRFTI